MPNLEEAIRERAYHLWIADGQPEGQADIFGSMLNANYHDLSLKAQAATLPPKRRRGNSPARAADESSIMAAMRRDAIHRPSA